MCSGDWSVEEWRLNVFSSYLVSVQYKLWEGESEETPMTLVPTSLQRVGNYDLAGEDPAIYDGMDPSTPREWKEVPLPTRQATEAAPQPGPSPMLPQADPDIIIGLLEVHHAYTNVLKSLGVDACKDYGETRVETLLSKIVSSDRKCKLCDKSYFSTQKLKNHMRKRHLGKTPYQCGECHRYYGDSQSLKIHMKKHASAGEEGQQFTCGVYNKSFLTVGKLNQHSEKHQDIRCEYCNKSFAYICTMKAHAAESCSGRPGQSSKDPAKASSSKKSVPEGPRWRCHKCSAYFGAHRNLKKHLNSKHDGVDIPVGYKPS